MSKLQELIRASGFSADQFKTIQLEIFDLALEEQLPDELISKMMHPLNDTTKLSVFAIKDYKDGYNPSIYLDYRIPLSAAIDISASLKEDAHDKAQLLHDFCINNTTLSAAVFDEIRSYIFLGYLTKENISKLDLNDANILQTIKQVKTDAINARF